MTLSSHFIFPSSTTSDALVKALLLEAIPNKVFDPPLCIDGFYPIPLLRTTLPSFIIATAIPGTCG
jgi:hypothetical protein